MDKELKLALNNLLKDQDFRTFLVYVYEASNMAGSPFTANALTTARNCGKLEMGQEIFSLLHDAAPYFYSVLMKGILDDLTDRRDDTASPADD
jgi:hypothetical protein